MSVVSSDPSVCFSFSVIAFQQYSLQLFVPLSTTFVCYLIVAYGISDNTINFIVAPLVLTWLLAYFVSSMFSEIFR